MSERGAMGREELGSEAEGAQMLRGLSTVSYWADDLEAAKEWYAELLGVEPYFERPGYYEFRVGDYGHEMGLIDSRYAPASSANGPGGAVLSCIGTSTTCQRPWTGCSRWAPNHTSP